MTTDTQRLTEFAKTSKVLTPRQRQRLLDLLDLKSIKPTILVGA